MLFLWRFIGCAAYRPFRERQNHQWRVSQSIIQHYWSKLLRLLRQKMLMLNKGKELFHQDYGHATDTLSISCHKASCIALRITATHTIFVRFSPQWLFSVPKSEETTLPNRFTLNMEIVAEVNTFVIYLITN